jgi:hypothetical protein
MKSKFFLLLFASASLASAQLVVTDPVSYDLQALQFGKVAEQWKTELTHYNDLFKQAEDALKIQNYLKIQIGDWQGVYDRAKTLETTVTKLTHQPGISFENVLKLDYSHDIPGGAKDPLGYTNNGNFAPIITKDATGANVLIPPETMRRYGVVENAYENFATVYKNTEPDLSAAQKELGETYADMSRAGVTQADYSKLAGKAQALQSRVAQLSQQRREASEMIAAQTALNQNQAKKEAEAAQRVQDANFEAFNQAVAHIQYAPFKWR